MNSHAYESALRASLRTPKRPVSAILRSLWSWRSLAQRNLLVRTLFGLRRGLGRILSWNTSLIASTKSFTRVPEQDRQRSLVAPGTADGPFTVLYVHPHEAVSEVRNATVHAFSVLALQPSSRGYRLFWAIYVAPVSWLTAFYMALINPFRRLIIYPALLRHLHRARIAMHRHAIA